MGRKGGCACAMLNGAETLLGADACILHSHRTILTLHVWLCKISGPVATPSRPSPGMVIPRHGQTLAWSNLLVPRQATWGNQISDACWAPCNSDSVGV
eukprot:359651-Chlamydomonas_euryale.AAC.7